MKVRVKDTLEIIDVYQVSYNGYRKSNDITDHREFSEEDLEFIFDKDRYFIIGPDGVIEKYLTSDEYKIYKEIIDHVSDEYNGGYIIKVPETHNVYKELKFDRYDTTGMTYSEIHRYVYNTVYDYFIKINIKSSNAIDYITDEIIKELENR